VFAAVVFQQRYPDSPWVVPIWVFGLATATTTAITRVTSGRHFPTDVLVGAAVGSLTGWLIPRLHKKDKQMKGITLVTGSKTGIRIWF
jgi:membrane-associated phospholipid phosphatase